MHYEIKGGAFPVVVCSLHDGEQMITERGSMVGMTATPVFSWNPAAIVDILNCGP